MLLFSFLNGYSFLFKCQLRHLKLKINLLSSINDFIVTSKQRMYRVFRKIVYNLHLSSCPTPTRNDS